VVVDWLDLQPAESIWIMSIALFEARLALAALDSVVPPTGFKGNKASLPSKRCVTCGRPMSWRRRWAANWDEVKYCSDACRFARPAGGRSG
jgi:hypothetical protein